MRWEGSKGESTNQILEIAHGVPQVRADNTRMKMVIISCYTGCVNLKELELRKTEYLF